MKNQGWHLKRVIGLGPPVATPSWALTSLLTDWVKGGSQMTVKPRSAISAARALTWLNHPPCCFQLHGGAAPGIGEGA